MRHTDEGLYKVLEKILREANRGMSCVELYDFPEVREHAASPNRVSDYLGNLWRRGFCTRTMSPGDDKSRARWLYKWKDATVPKVITGEPAIEGVEIGRAHV